VESVDVARLVIEALNDLNVAYMVVGSLASNVYGVARNTQDADFVIETDDDLASIHQRLRECFRAEPQIGFETVQMSTKHVLYHRDTDFRVELFVLSNDPHDRERFRRRVWLEQEGNRVCLPTVEDVIVQKLRWRRKKDIADVTNVIDAQHPNLDWPYILRWVEAHGSGEALNAVCAELGIAPGE
jgi:hypothetical protein